MSQTSRIRTAALLSVPLLTAVLVGPASAAVSNVSSVSGSAYGESVDITSPLAIASGPTPTVTLPSAGGGPVTASLASVSVPGALTAGVLDVSTVGSLGPAGSATSSADVANVAIASALTATAISSTCTADPSGSTGSSNIVGAVIGGQPVAVSPPPNTVIPIGLGEIRLNEQIVSGDASSSAITVNAVHVVFNTAALMGDIIIAQSHCDVADDGTGVPVGAIGGLALSALLGAGFLAWTLIHRHRAAQA